MLSSIRDTLRCSRVYILVIILDTVVAFAAKPLPSPCNGCLDIKKRQRNLALLYHPRDSPMKPDSDTTAITNCAGSLVNFVEIVDDFGSNALVSQINSDDGNICQFIRLENEPDKQTMRDISSKDYIVQKINEVQNEQTFYGRSDLYDRNWESCGRENHESNVTVAHTTFTVMQFNVLAEGLSSSTSKRPFKDDKVLDQRDPAGYGGFSSIQHPLVTLDFERRKWRLVEILFGPNLDSIYDVIGLEEVDRYRGFFGPLLHIFGYGSIFVPKKNSPGVRMGWYSDGCVLAWKTCTFNLIHECSGDYTVGNQVYIIATLQHRLTMKYLVVAVTHLKSQQNEINEKVRCRQVDELLSAIDGEVMRLANAFSGEQAQIVVLGDFNSDPPSTIDFDCSAIQKLLGHKNPIVHVPYQYRSAYAIDNPPEDMFTTWKIRGTKVSKRIIDYVFYAGSSIRCIATYKTIDPNGIEDSKLPGLRHPSDHLHIAAKFEFL